MNELNLATTNPQPPRLSPADLEGKDALVYLSTGNHMVGKVRSIWPSGIVMVDTQPLPISANGKLPGQIFIPFGSLQFVQILDEAEILKVAQKLVAPNP